MSAKSSLKKVGKKVKSKLKKLHVPRIAVHINASFNNTLVTVTKPEGDTVSWSSAGACGFKGARKSTPFAAQTAVEVACKIAKEMGATVADVFVKGPGNGREAAIRAVANLFDISSIKDITPIPHNGVRKKKERRV